MNDNDKLNEYITTAEAAKILEVTQRRILQLCAEDGNPLEAVKLGGRWLVKREAVYRYKY